jgi:penicillin amidase
MIRRARRWALPATGAVLLLMAGVAGWVWHDLRASLPRLSGEQVLTGLYAPVAISRDELGVTTVTARSHADQARGVGFVHAQERYFQMDLLRRSAAGELAALVGAAALPVDRRVRVHQMRKRVTTALRDWDTASLQLLVAYAEGVNAGLAALGSPSFEYRLLQTRPEAWQPEDSLLVIAAMYFTLQDSDGRRKQRRTLMQQALPAEVTDWLLPEGSSWDAPITGEQFADPPLPDARAIDLRRLDADRLGDGISAPPLPPPVFIGSNSWAVAGRYTRDGRALLANDMHLGLQVPALWFRTTLVLDDAMGGRTQASGVTLPGLPFLVVGSNGHIAWGFTNSYGDWTDLLLLETDPADPGRYRTPEGWAELRREQETLEVRDGPDHSLEVQLSGWGPVVGELPDGTPLAVRWMAHEPAGFAPAYVELVSAQDVSTALEIAQRAGIPAQNFVVGDRHGNIGWTTTGPMPQRRTDHPAGDAIPSSLGSSWLGFVPHENRPRIENPPAGRIWTANSRIVGGEWLRMIGDGGYALGARGTQIRDRLLALEQASAEDMLALQLDDEARFLARWHARLEALLDDAAITANPARAVLRDRLRQWEGRAAADAIAYGLVRQWRKLMIGAMAHALTSEVRALDPGFRYAEPAAEAWAWPLLAAEPAHLLHPAHDSWRDWQLALVDRLIAEHAVGNPADARFTRTWGEHNTSRVHHPLSAAVPWLGRWLNMPPQALPGDAHMPRVQAQTFGASQRMVVSPGDEASGLFHLPGGHSGHPLSPFFGAGHTAWADGEPTPLLPGAPAYRLVLTPED